MPRPLLRVHWHSLLSHTWRRLPPLLTACLDGRLPLSFSVWRRSRLKLPAQVRCSIQILRTRVFRALFPVAVYRVPPGLRISRVTVDNTLATSAISDGVDVMIYADGMLRRTITLPPTGYADVPLNDTLATATVAVRVDPRGNCNGDSTHLLIDVWAAGPAPDSSFCAVTTLAGSGLAGSSGDGGPATSASLSSPSGIAFLPGTGDLLVASESQARMRIVYASNGTIGPFAGSGTSGYAGDGGSATAARLRSPSGVAVLPSGAVLIADVGDNRVRVVWPNGTIDTWMGDGNALSTGDGLFRTAARLNQPWKVFVHPITNDAYISERAAGGACIRRVDGRTGIVSTVVGAAGSSATVALVPSRPHDFTAMAGRSDVFIMSQAGSSTVYWVNTASKVALFLAGDGTATYNGDGNLAAKSQLSSPAGLAWHAASGSVLVSDSGNGRIRAFAPWSTISTVAVLSSPSALIWQPSTGALVVSDSGGHRVLAVSSACFPAGRAVSCPEL